MADVRPMAAPDGPFKFLQTQSLPRRMRPPDLDMAEGDENRVPLRADKLGRRESRIGLRSIFGRAKNANDGGSATYREPALSPRSGGIRASLAEISGWPHPLHTQRSEGLLSVLSLSTRPQSTAIRAPTPNPGAKHMKSISGTKGPATTPRATWDPPPLFQAYPQAIKHATLPACSVPVEAILRLNGGKEHATLRDWISHAATDPTSMDELDNDKGFEKTRRKHRRDHSASSMKFNWTTKIYVLVTSGYLLQYAAEGSFDRLPEKMLQLGKDSAAFASDLIPGRHWVLQVCAAMDGSGTAPLDSRSLFSRLPFRGSERRHASNFLMVFEGAGDMESWIVVLRREIEALGGKKNLSETGKPKADDHILQLRVQPSQRTLVVRDPDRFSRIITQDMPWDNHETPRDSSDVSPDAAESGATEQSFDDVSTTSGISHDGRQLESLRDSAHRLSYISSGQRTMITSEGSSRAGSPTRDSFASQLDDLPMLDVAVAEARPRPNAAAILERRQSMQSANPLVDFRSAGGAAPRPHSIYSTNPPQEPSNSSVQAPQHTTPNFSVPQSVGKRYSLVKSPGLEAVPFTIAPTPMTTRPAPGARGSRRLPPTALSMSRPLSIVADQPSPPPADEDRKMDVDGDETLTTAPDTPSIFSTWTGGSEAIAFPMRKGHSLPRRPSLFQHLQETSANSTERAVLRKNPGFTPPVLQSSAAPEDRAESLPFVFPRNVSTPPVPPHPEPWADVPRSRSAMDFHARVRSPSPLKAREGRPQHHQPNIYSQSLDQVPRLGSASSADAPAPSLASLYELPPLRPSPPDLTKRLPTVPRMSTSTQHLRVGSAPPPRGHVAERRSLPHLVIEGPPPAPPPTCGLPPIPAGKRPGPGSSGGGGSVRLRNFRV